MDSDEVHQAFDADVRLGVFVNDIIPLEKLAEIKRHIDNQDHQRAALSERIAATQVRLKSLLAAANA